MADEGLQALRDEELARLARDGREDGFEALVDRYAGRLRRFLGLQTRNAHDAEDLTQAAFVAAFRKLDRYDPGRPFAPWLFTIARRLAISQARAARPCETLSEDLPAADDPRGAVMSADGEARVWETARAALSETAFTALWLRHAEGMTVREIAQAMRKTPVHVWVLLHRGRRALAERLTRDGEGARRAAPAGGRP